jgi:L-alanine-DL-glutamate epimerase-like enolase superfamily enzyme
VHVPRDRPGLGITVDTDLIDELTVRTEELRPSNRTVVGT